MVSCFLSRCTKFKGNASSSSKKKLSSIGMHERASATMFPQCIAIPLCILLAGATGIKHDKMHVLRLGELGFYNLFDKDGMPKKHVLDVLECFWYCQKFLFSDWAATLHFRKFATKKS